MSEGVPIDEVLEAITGHRPEPVEIKNPEWRRLRDLEGEARRANRITDERMVGAVPQRQWQRRIKSDGH